MRAAEQMDSLKRDESVPIVKHEEHIVAVRPLSHRKEGGTEMPWGMALPNGFGQFWPDGEFEGWDQRLMSHNLAQPPEVRRALYDGHADSLDCAVDYPLYVSRKLVSELGSRHSPHPWDPPFTPVEDHEPPQSFTTKVKCNALASLINLNDRIVAVDYAFQSLIEAFEPGLHRFFPIEIVMPKGALFERQFFILWLGQYRDSFVQSASDENAFEELPNSRGKLSLNRASPSTSVRGLALSKDRIEGAHLWRERKFGEWLTCFSDELHTAIGDSGILLPPMWQIRDV